LIKGLCNVCLKIRNNKNNDGRMPFIVPDELADKWLTINGDDKAGKHEVLSMIRPYDEEEITAYPVGRLRGKQAVGNEPDALKEVDYHGVVLEQ
jgi:putative SOS response-associated peptidase YedK